jgi:hypothetical protein
MGKRQGNKHYPVFFHTGSEKAFSNWFTGYLRGFLKLENEPSGTVSRAWWAGFY